MALSKQEREAEYLLILAFHCGLILCAGPELAPADGECRARRAHCYRLDPFATIPPPASFVSSLYQQQGRFQAMSDAIISRIDEMGARVDDLEKSITELMHNAGQAGATAGSAAAAGGASGGAADK